MQHLVKWSPNIKWTLLVLLQYEQHERPSQHKYRQWTPHHVIRTKWGFWEYLHLCPFYKVKSAWDVYLYYLLRLCQVGYER